MCVSLVRQPKYPSKLVHGQLAYIPYLEFRRLRAHLELDNLYPVCYDWGLVTLVKGRVEHLDGIGVKLV